MKKVYNVYLFFMTLLIFFGINSTQAREFEPSDITDSIFLMEKSRNPSEPVHNYLTGLSENATREEMSSVINERIIKSTTFQYEAMEVDVPGSVEDYSALDEEKRDMLKIANWELLHELYPDAIRKRVEKASGKIALRLPVKKIEMAQQLKGSVYSFVNDVITNDRIPLDENFIRYYFEDNKQNEFKLIKSDIESLKAVRNQVKLPINALVIDQIRPGDENVKILISERGKRGKSTSFRIVNNDSKKWSIVSFREFSGALLGSGYISANANGPVGRKVPKK